MQEKLPNDSQHIVMDQNLPKSVTDFEQIDIQIVACLKISIKVHSVKGGTSGTVPH